MIRSRWLFLSPLAAVLFAAGAGSARAQSEQTIILDEGAGTVVKVTHLLSDLPPAGAASLRVSVTNGGARPLQILVGAESETMGHRRGGNTLATGFPEFTTEPGATVVKEFTAPLLSVFEYGGGTLRVTAGPPGTSRSVSFSGGRTDGKTFVGLSSALAGKNLNDLQKALSGGGHSYNNPVRVASFDPAHAPADWRGWTGLDLLCLTADEWNRMDGTRQLAVRQWVMAGGALEVRHTGAAPAAALGQLMAPKSVPEDEPFPLGHGTVRLSAWEGKPLEPGDMARYEPAAGESSRAGNTLNALTTKRIDTTLVKKGLDADIPLFSDAMGERSFAAWQVGIILVLFGVMVGPVNLFYFAGAGKRHRVFYTTPLISLAASLVLVVVIFLQDGAGGEGVRAAVVYVRPEDNLSYVRQYQAARTGALFGSSFSVPDTALVTPAAMKASRWTRVDREGGQSQSYTVGQDGIHGGDWFQSRSEQALIVESLQPGRGRVERQAGGAEPALVSRFGFTLNELWYLDDAGTWWKSGGAVATGGSASLTRADTEDAERWMRTTLRPFPDREVNQLTSHAPVPGFYATASDPAAGMLPTLSSIRWRDDLLFLHGPVPEAR